MDLTRLYYFKITAELEHITRAAAALDTNQPFLSKCIRDLENELHTRLFTRQGRGIALTEAGKTYYQYVKNIFENLEDGARALENLSAQETATLRIGTNACSFLPDFFRQVREKCPALRLRQTTGPLDTLLSRTEKGETDFAIVVSPTELTIPSPLCSLPLFKTGLRLLLSKEHPLASRKSLDFASIAKEPILSAPTGYGLTDCLLWQFQKRQTAPDIAVETTDIAILPRYAAAGVGICAFPASIPPSLLPENAASLPFAEPDAFACLTLLWKEGRYQSPLALDFRKLAGQFFTLA